MYDCCYYADDDGDREIPRLHVFPSYVCVLTFFMRRLLLILVLLLMAGCADVPLVPP